jgi:hypothetical protein
MLKLRKALKTRRVPAVRWTQEDRERSFNTKETGAQEKYTPNWQAHKPYTAMETRKSAVPRCTVVSGQIDLDTGGVQIECVEAEATPMRKLIP